MHNKIVKSSLTALSMMLFCNKHNGLHMNAMI